MTAAGFLAVVTALTFVSVFLRYLFAWQIPDTYDFGRLLLGTLIFWGIAATGYRGEHITVDLLWSVAPRPVRLAMDLLAQFVTLGAMAVFAWMMMVKVLDTRRGNVLTFDLNLPVWLFYLVAWLGLAAAVVLLVARIVRLASGHPDPDGSSKAGALE
nr:TRAP transporter small permease [Propylenella binzhouense]